MQSTTTRRRTIILYAVLAITAIIMLSIFSRIDNWRRDLTTNFAQLDPSASDPELRPIHLEAPREDVADRIQRWVEDHSQWQMVSSDEDADRIHLHLTRTTGLFRFVDDVHVQIVNEDQGVRVEAESQSRVGKGDLGQNPRNLKELVKGLGTTQP